MAVVAAERLDDDEPERESIKLSSIRLKSDILSYRALLRALGPKKLLLYTVKSAERRQYLNRKCGLTC
jgi:hypothetical protein